MLNKHHSLPVLLGLVALVGCTTTAREPWPIDDGPPLSSPTNTSKRSHQPAVWQARVNAWTPFPSCARHGGADQHRLSGTLSNSNLAQCQI
jgi:hypothetical protein